VQPPPEAGAATSVGPTSTDGGTVGEPAASGVDAPAGAPAHGARWWQVRRRALLLAWATLVVVVWNVVFDWVVIEAGRDYLTQQALHQRGGGPAVTIPGVMRPGIVRGFWFATLAAAGAAAVGALLFWAAGWRQRRADRDPAGT
jgi:hypothetical protein